MARYTLTYFDLAGGRGEDCRLALHLGGADWVDQRVSRAAWGDRKPSTPWGGLPVLEVEGRGEIGQSNAILAYLGRELGLHPEDPFEAARHEAILAAVEDLRALVAPTLFVQDPDERRRLREALVEGPIPAWGARIDRHLGEGPYVAGDRLCVADLKLFVVHRWIASGALDHVPADVLAPFPRLTRLVDAVRAHPGVQAWYAR